MKSTTTYTKYHKKYHQKNREKLKRDRMKRYYLANYGIPLDRGDLLSAFFEHKPLYLKLRHVAQRFPLLHPELIQRIVSHAKVDASGNDPAIM